MQWPDWNSNLPDRPDEKDLILAVRACLDPLTDNPPTVQQKELVWGYIGKITELGVIVPTATENHLVDVRLNARRAVGLELYKMIGRDPYQQRQMKANK